MQPNDVLIAAVYFDERAIPAVTPPAGFTFIRQQSSSSFQAVALYYHVASAGDPSTFTWTASPGPSGFTGVISAYGGAYVSSPIDVSAGQTGTTPNADAPSATTTSDGDMLVGVWSAWNGSLSLTPPAAMSVRQAFNGSDPLVLADKPLSAAGPTGVQTASTSADPGFWTGQAVALRATPSGPQADMSVSKTVSSSTINDGQDLTYTIVVGNGGLATAANVVWQDTLPGTFRSLSVPAGWTCSTPSVGARGSVSCSNPSVALDAFYSFTLVINVSGAGGGTLSNTATVSSDTPDPNPSNNSSTASVTVQPQTDMAISMTSGSSTVYAGQNVTYTIVTTNNGPSVASNATLDDNLPPNTSIQGLTIQEGPGSTGWSCGTAGGLHCNVGLLNPGNTTRFTLVMSVNSNAPAGTVISNGATVGNSYPDPNPANNSATVNVTVQTQADLTVAKSASSSSVAAGQNLSYTILATNNGPSSAINTRLSDTTPPNTTFQSLNSPSGWNCTAPAVGGTGTVTCTNAGLAPAAPAPFALVVNVNAATSGGTVISNTATISSDTPDPNLSNNSSSTSATVQAPSPIAFRSASGSDSQGLVVTVSRPASLQPNDVLIAAVYWDNSTGATVTPPAGFTLIRQDSSPSNQAVGLYLYVATASDPATFTWTASQSVSGFTGIISAYSGVNTAGPIDVSGGQTGSTPNANAPSVTTTVAGDWLIGVWSSWNSSMALRPPAAMSVRQAFSAGDPLVLADKPLGSPGPTGTQTTTTSADPGFWTGQSIALRAGP